MMNLQALLRLAFQFLLVVTSLEAFTPTVRPASVRVFHVGKRRSAVATDLSSDKDVVSGVEGEEGADDDDEPRSSRLRNQRWASLNPKVKARIVQEAQERAIANKKKREPAQDKKRRMMNYFRDEQRADKRAARVRRPLSFDNRTPLAALMEGMETTGLVISLTKFGAYVDVGTECDGLLHISQLSDTEFISHPRQVLTPGDEIVVRIRSVNPSKKKLHLTMLSQEALEAEKRKQEDDHLVDRIGLEDLMVDDELWGELRRVTDYGAYVEIGAAVDGWLHFMDHPGWIKGDHPTEFMKRGDRVRVWVAVVDLEEERVRLTANRPEHLPGPRRDL